MPKGTPGARDAKVIMGDCAKAPGVALGDFSDRAPIKLAAAKPHQKAPGGQTFQPLRPNPKDKRLGRLEVSDSGRCVVVGREKNENNSHLLTVIDCEDANTKAFYHNENGNIEAHDACLDIQRAGILWMAGCDGHAGKVFRHLDGQLYNPKTRQCVGLDGDAKNDGVRLKITGCESAVAFTFSKDSAPLAKVMGVRSSDLPSLGDMPFYLHEQGRNYVTGQVKFLGRLTDATVFKPAGATKSVLALMPHEIDLSELFPGFDKTVLAAGVVRNFVFMIALEGTDAKNIDVNTLPEQLRGTLKSSFGDSTHFSVPSGLSYFGNYIGENNRLAGFVKPLGISLGKHQMWGSLSPMFVVADHTSSAGRERLLKEKADALIKGQDFRLSLPSPKLPGLDPVLKLGQNAIAITQDRAPVLFSNAELKLPGKSIPLTGRIESVENGWAISGQSNISWDKPMGIPFINMENIGFKATLGKNKTVKFALTSTTELGGQKFNTENDLVITKKGIKDFNVGFKGEVPITRLPGIDKIPGVNELKLSDLRVGLHASTGTIEWQRLGLKGQAVLMEHKGAFTVLLKSDGLSVGKLLPAAPFPFNSINFPKTALFLSSKTLEKVMISELPKPAQALLTDLVASPKEKAPIYNGVGMIATLTPDNIPQPLRGLLVDDIGVFEQVDGPLRLVGAVENLFGSLPDLVLKANMPGFSLPKNQPLAKVVNFDKVGADFFLRAKLSAGGVFQAGVGGEMTVSVPEVGNPQNINELRMRGEVMGNVDIVSVAGSVKVAAFMDGRWDKPFGINENISIEDPAIVMGVDTEGSIEFGVGGNSYFRTQGGRDSIELKGDFLVNINFTSSIPLPKKLGIAFQANQVSIFNYLDMADSMFKGVLTGPMAHGLVEILPPPQRDIALFMRKEIAQNDTSLRSLLQIDKLPFPYMVYRDVELFFATPGAVIPGRGETLDTVGAVVAGEAELHMQGHVHKLGETENRITLKDGLNLRTEIADHEFGPVALTDSKFHAVASLTEEPKLEFKSKARLFGSTSDVDIKIKPTLTTIRSEQNFGDLLQFDFNAFAGTESLTDLNDLANADFRISSELSSDPGEWIRTTGVSEVQKIFDSLNHLNRKAEEDLTHALNEVNKLNDTIEAMRNQVRTERRDSTKKLSDAQAEVRTLQNRINSLHSWIGQEKSYIENNCQKWIGPIFDVIGSGICAAGPLAKITGYGTELAALEVAKETADKVLEAIKQGHDFLPIDMDPRVTGPMAARDVALVALDTAKLAAKGATAFNSLVKDEIAKLQTPDIFALETSKVRGSLREAIGGEPVIVELAYRSLGTSYKERMALSMTDPDFNLRQMTTFAFGLAIKPFLDSARQVGVIPHFILDGVEQEYMKQRAQLDAAFQNAANTNGVDLDSDVVSASISNQILNQREARQAAEVAERERLMNTQIVSLGNRTQRGLEALEKFGDGATLLSIRTHAEDWDRPYDLCFESTTETNHRGANKVIFNVCEDKPSQIFVMSEDGLVHDIAGRCLDFQEEGKVWLYDCTGHPDMHWTINDNQLYNPNKGQCLRAAGAPIKPGMWAEVDRCQYRSAKVVDVRERIKFINWRLSEYGSQARMLEIKTQTSSSIPLELCITRAQARAEDPNYERVDFRRCDYSFQQTFILTADGEIRDHSRNCMGFYDQDLRLGLTSCSGHPNQKWQLRDGQLYNPHRQECVRAYGHPIKEMGDAEADPCSRFSALANDIMIRY
ncbi:ricin-type beta-trefoil lectin domain protein [Magnetovibrio sp. PR-2]|uniref:ricin-type beta-trefoil lectin domain protein n=1 Tax=Magnetovibrio sp. PR-2 TaxID=3120356 RepID=UPI002FCE468B